MSLARYRLLSRTFRKSFDRLYSSHFRRYESYLFKVMFACSMPRSYTAATPRWQVIDSGRCWWAGWDGDDPRNNRFAVGRPSESDSVVQNALLLQKVIVRRAPCSKGACYNIIKSSQKSRVVPRTFTLFSQTIRRGPCRGYTSEEDAFSMFELLSPVDRWRIFESDCCTLHETSWSLELKTLPPHSCGDRCILMSSATRQARANLT